MEPTETDLATRQLGKFLLFITVGAVSGLLLYGGWTLVTHGDSMGYLAMIGSTLFWWPLFRLGVYHARRSKDAS